jgi:hypothetical protein
VLIKEDILQLQFHSDEVFPHWRFIKEGMELHALLTSLLGMETVVSFTPCLLYTWRKKPLLLIKNETGCF